MQTLKVATAFSGGFGSVEFALKYLDIKHEVVFAVEYMKPQRESYISNHGEPTDCFYEDIKEFTGTKYKGEIDYFHLSPPCQSYSLAGSRAGAADERGGLMFEAIRAIDEVQPKMFSVENVRGLLSSNNGEDWKNIMRDFKSLKGYTISWGIMNAKEQGTPQNRERVFIVGFRANCMLFDFPQRQQLKYKLFDLLENDVSEKYFLSEKMLKGFEFHKDRHQKRGNGFGIKTKNINSIIAGSISCKAGNRQTDNYIELNQVGNIDTKGHNSLWGRVYSTNGIAPTQNAKGGGAGAKTGLFVCKSIKESVRSNFVRDYDEIVKSDKNIFYSECKSGFQDNKVCLTESACLRANNKDTFTLDSEKRIRRLTPRECARVQGDFKDMFKLDGFSDTKLYEFIGNAMDISTTKNLISKMLDFLEKIELNKPSEPTFIKKENIQINLFGEVA